MTYLKELEINDECLKLFYTFMVKTNRDFKKRMQISFLLNRIDPPAQGNLTDFEYFRKLVILKQEHSSSKEYLVINNEIMVAYVSVLVDNETAKVGITALKDNQRQEWIKVSLALIEEIIFKNNYIKEIVISDIFKNDLGLDYTYDEERKVFRKSNPLVKKNTLIKDKFKKD